MPKDQLPADSGNLVTAPVVPDLSAISTQANIPLNAHEETAADSAARESAGDASRFAGYVILGTLGRGGMGIVYKARHLELDRLVALKTIRFEASRITDSLERFAREARILAQLNNPSIVSIYEIQSTTELPFFAMEFVGGGTLAEHRDSLRDPRKAAALVAKVARAIHYAHEHSILHRDLKPQNILLDEHEQPKISDFGLAKLYEGDCDLTQSGDTLGTPGYMAPEQAAGRSADFGPATDIWALGVILFELVMGERPFTGLVREAILQKIIHADVVFPRTAAAIDPGLQTIILKCLEKAPKDRYASAQLLAADLDAWLTGAPLSVRPQSRFRRAMKAVRPRHLAVAAALLLVPLAVMIWRLQREELPPRTDPPAVLEQYKLQLAAGKPVELLGATGAPAWYRWRTETHRAPIVPGQRAFDLGSPGLCLMELMPNGSATRFHLRAEVLDSASPSGEVGLYFAHSPHVTAKGMEHWFTAFRFSENPGPNDDAARSPRWLVMRYREKSPTTSQLYFQFDVVRGQAIEAKTRKWRALDVKVTPGKIEVSWEGKPLHETAPDDLAKMFAAPLYLSDPGKEPPPAFNASGGMGFYVNRANASFRNVVISQLP